MILKNIAEYCFFMCFRKVICKQAPQNTINLIGWFEKIKLKKTN